MSDLIRDAPIGQFIRFVTRNRVLQYPEEKPDFQCPSQYAAPDAETKQRELDLPSPSSVSHTTEDKLDPADLEKAGADPTEPVDHEPLSSGMNRQALERIETHHSELDKDMERHASARSQRSHVSTNAALALSATQADLQEAFRAATLQPEASRPIIPQRTADGTILVDWYTTDDPANPQNWRLRKKLFVSLEICKSRKSMPSCVKDSD